MDLQLHPARQPRRRRQPRQPDGLLRVHRAAGIWEQQVFRRVDEIQDIRGGIVFAREIRPAQRHGHDFRAAGLQGRGHELVGREFARPHHEAGGNSRPERSLKFVRLVCHGEGKRT